MEEYFEKNCSKNRNLWSFLQVLLATNIGYVSSNEYSIYDTDRVNYSNSAIFATVKMLVSYHPRKLLHLLLQEESTGPFRDSFSSMKSDSTNCLFIKGNNIHNLYSIFFITVETFSSIILQQLDLHA